MAGNGERFKPWLIAVGVAVLATVALVALAQLPRASSYSDREAIAQCEGFADKRLKAPSTAEYDLSASESEGVWTVIGTVDSQNSFGGMVRGDVECVLHFTADRAVLDSIAVD